MASEFADFQLINNPSPRVPITLVLDVSYSMKQAVRTSTRLALMNAGLAAFVNSVANDEYARYSAELSLIAFDSKAYLLSDFAPVTSYVNRLSSLDTGRNAGTNIAAAVELALDHLERRKALYRSNGIAYYQPWLVLISDGEPTTGDHAAMAQRVVALESASKLVVMPVGVCEQAATSALSLFSRKRKPLYSATAEFGSFFEFLSASLSSVSQSQPGDEIDLRPAAQKLEGWSSI